jgi:hypothetical protein
MYKSPELKGPCSIINLENCVVRARHHRKWTAGARVVGPIPDMILMQFLWLPFPAVGRINHHV